MTEYRSRLIDRYTAAELCEILDIPIEELLDAFEYRWIDNKFLLEEVGLLEEDE